MSNILKNDGGATAIEYSLIAALIAVAIIAALDTLGDNASTTFETISDEIASANAAGGGGGGGGGGDSGS